MRELHLIVIPEARFSEFRGYLDEIASTYQLGTQSGVLKDGRRFIYRVKSPDWLDRLRGIRIKSYESWRGAPLTTYEVASLQAMMQIS